MINQIKFKVLTFAMLGLSTASAFGESPAEKAKGVQEKLTAAAALIDGVLPNIQNADDKIKLFEAKDKILSSKTVAEDLEKVLANKAGLDAYVAEARALQKIAMGFLGKEDTFGHEVVTGPIDIDISLDGEFGDIIRKRIGRIGFGRIEGQGRIRFNPGSDVAQQLNAVRAELYGVLAEAAALDRTDPRVYQIAKAASDTRFHYRDDISGESIITYFQFTDLKLEPRK